MEIRSRYTLAFAVLFVLSGCAAELTPADVTLTVELSETENLVNGDTISVTATGALAGGRADEVLIRIERSDDGSSWEILDESLVAGPELSSVAEVELTAGPVHYRAEVVSAGDAQHTLVTSRELKLTVHDRREAPSLLALERLTDADQPGCSAAVAVRGEVVWAGANGVANFATGEPLTTESRFDIASESKQFTATAILMLQREGLLALSDPIAKYVDGLPWWGESITLDQLMHHTSHIPDYWIKLGDWGYGFTTPASQADAVRAIAAEPDLLDIEVFAYSNSNYILLAEVVKKVSGQALPDFLKERIFGPVGVEMVLDPIAQSPDIAVSHDDFNHSWRSGWAFYGAVGIFTTPSELVRWGDQYRAGEIIADDFSVGAVNSTEDDEVDVGRLYGAGIYIDTDGYLGHLGRIGGYISKFGISPDRETVVSVMCNGHLANRYGVFDALWAIWVPPAGE